jgi:hypothetical protein
MSFLTLLPLSFVMIAGAQIVSSVFLATSENWGRNSGAYVLGAALSITLMVTIAFFALNGVSDAGASDDALYIVVLVLLVLAALHTFLTRKTSEPPKWMGKLQSASPRFCFTLGFLLLGFFPTDPPHVGGRRHLPSRTRRPVVARPSFYCPHTSLPRAARAGGVDDRAACSETPAKGPGLDDHEFVGHQRDRDLLFHRSHGDQPLITQGFR